MGLIDGMRKKFARPNVKIIRICTVTGNVDKLEKLLGDHSHMDLSKIRVVSGTPFFLIVLPLLHFMLSSSHCITITSITIDDDTVCVLHQDGKTPLQLAVKHSYFYIVRYLVERYAVNVDDLSDFGQTALHIACANDLVDIASYLISVNAALEIRDNAGKMPVDLCPSPDLKFLLEKAINRNKGDNGSELLSVYAGQEQEQQSLTQPLPSSEGTTSTSNSTDSPTAEAAAFRLSSVDSDGVHRFETIRSINTAKRDSLRGPSMHMSDGNLSKGKKFIPSAARNNFDLDDFEGIEESGKSASFKVQVNMNDFDEEDGGEADDSMNDQSMLPSTDGEEVLVLQTSTVLYFTSTSYRPFSLLSK